MNTRVLTVLCLACGAAMARPRLVVDTWQEPRLLGATLQRPAARNHFELIYVLVYRRGQTLYDTALPTLVRAPEAAGAAPLARLARDLPLPWQAAAELLEWSPPASDADPDLPVTLAVDASGSACVGQEAAYLAPHQGRNQALLAGLLAEWQRWPAQPAGVLLGFRMSRERCLGLDQASRGEFIRSQALDPAHPHGDDEVQAWARWREGSLTRVLGQLVGTLRKARPSLPVTALGTGDLPIRTPLERASSADNWLEWLATGVVDEVLLDTTWSADRTPRVWAILRALSTARLRATGRSYLGSASQPLARLRPLVYSGPPTARHQTPGRHERQPDWEAQFSALRTSGAPVENAVFYPRSLEELDQVLALLDREAKTAKPTPGAKQP